MTRHVTSALVAVTLIVLLAILSFSTLNTEAVATEPPSSVTCTIEALTGTVAHIVCIDGEGNPINVGDIILPEITVPGPTITLPPLPPITLPPLPPVTIKVPQPAQTETVRVPVPGPTSTATIRAPGATKTIDGPTSTVTIPGATETVTRASEPIPGPTTTATATATETVTAEPTGQPATTPGTIEPTPSAAPEPQIFPQVDLGTPGAVGLGFLSILLIATLILIGMYTGYYLGYKDGDKNEAKFLRALLGK